MEKEQPPLATAAASPTGQINGLSLLTISRHLPPSSRSEVLPGLWVGNLMSVTNLADLVGRQENTNIRTAVTVVSVVSNNNLIGFATEAIAQQRCLLQHYEHDRAIYISEIRHVVIPLKDEVKADLLAVLPDALEAIDEALGSEINDARQTPNGKAPPNADIEINLRRICLVHCAKGESRSVSVVIAYLLSRRASKFQTFEDALEHVRAVRPHATPNMGFILSLRRFQRELSSARQGVNDQRNAI